MPFELTWEPRGVHRRYYGHVTTDERLQSFHAICADARFDDLRYTITDYLDAGPYEIDDRTTEMIAALHIGPLRTNPHIVMAAVAVQPPILDAIRRFKALRFTRAPYEIFAAETDARAWIARRHALPSRRN